MNYPTPDEVENADRYTLCKWWRFLRPPESDGQREVHALVFTRFNELGGFTIAISKDIGWEDIY